MQVAAVTVTLPPVSDVRDCRLYRFWVEHPVTGEEVLGYVGETVREPFDRFMEHVRDQPWMDTVTRWERDPRVFAGKAQVLQAERAAIRVEKPLYNVRENEGNGDRIIPPVAIRQRRARDAAKNGLRWVHPDDRDPAGMGVRLTSRSGVPSVAAGSWKPWQVKVALLSTSWVMTGVATWAAVGHFGLSGTWKQDLIVSSVASTVLLGWSLWRQPDSWRLWKGRLRRFRRALR